MVDITEIKRRLSILEKKKPIVINKRMLRGGMDSRNRRKSICKYNDDIKTKTKTYKDKLLELQQPSESTLFGISSATVSEDVMAIEEKFSEPKLKRTRDGGRGFF